MPVGYPRLGSLSRHRISLGRNVLIRQHSFHNPDDPCTHISPILNLVFFVVAAAAAVAVAVARAVAVGMWGAVVAVRGAVVVVKAGLRYSPLPQTLVARNFTPCSWIVDRLKQTP